MSALKTPGVYIEEEEKLPYFISQIDTAIPVFIGHTEKAPNLLEPIKIKSLLEFETLFGKANPEKIVLKDTIHEGLTVVKPEVKFLMYYALQMYFANGGGSCYIVAVGDYTNGVEYDNLYNGLKKIETLEAATLIIVPDATSLHDEEDFYKIQEISRHIAQDKKRFAILDTYQGNSITTTGPENLNTINYFRSRIGSTSYGAVYYPHLTTTLNYTFDEDAEITHLGTEDAEHTDLYANEKQLLNNLKAQSTLELEQPTPNAQKLGDLLQEALLIIEKVNETADSPIDLTDAEEVLVAIRHNIITVFNSPLDSDTGSFTDEFDNLIDALSNARDLVGNANGKTLNTLKTDNSILYHRIKKAIQTLHVVVPPSSTMAGVYAKTDSTKGIWKAPANIPLNYVWAPTEKISDKEQEALNVNDEGKSINVIRNFTGKGNLIWGARTFDSTGNWKYIQVRRLFNMIEKAVKQVADNYINQPNDPVTWLRAKATIENYLNHLWQQGALVGNTPEEAYIVTVDRPSKAKMNVKIEIALVRPAEFITINFSHKSQKL